MSAICAADALPPPTTRHHAQRDKSATENGERRWLRSHRRRTPHEVETDIRSHVPIRPIIEIYCQHRAVCECGVDCLADGRGIVGRRACRGVPGDAIRLITIIDFVIRREIECPIGEGGGWGPAAGCIETRDRRVRRIGQLHTDADASGECAAAAADRRNLEEDLRRRRRSHRQVFRERRWQERAAIIIDRGTIGTGLVIDGRILAGDHRSGIGRGNARYKCRDRRDQ